MEKVETNHISQLIIEYIWHESDSDFSKISVKEGDTSEAVSHQPRMTSTPDLQRHGQLSIVIFWWNQRFFNTMVRVSFGVWSNYPKQFKWLLVPAVVRSIMVVGELTCCVSLHHEWDLKVTQIKHVTSSRLGIYALKVWTGLLHSGSN